MRRLVFFGLCFLFLFAPLALAQDSTSIFFFRNATGFNAVEPKPNASASDDNFMAGSTWTSAGMKEIAGINGATAATPSLGSTTDQNISLISFISPPLVPQTISGTWAISGYFTESGTNDDLQVRLAIYAWADSNDSKKQNIVNSTTVAPELTTAVTFKVLSATGQAITFQRGDKLVAEIAFYGVSPTSAVGTLYYDGNRAATYDSNLIAPMAIRMAGDLNTGIVSPANNSTYPANTAFDVNAKGNCKNYGCGDTNVILQYCITPSNGCTVWYDMNTANSSPLYVSSGQVFRRDSNLAVLDVNYFVFSVQATQGGTYSIRSKIDSNWSEDINYSNLNNADVNITVFTPPPDANVLYPMNGESFDKTVIPTVDINVNTKDADNNAISILFDINYSTSQTEGTGTVIINDGNVASATGLRCDSNDLSVARNCKYAWDISSITNGNYYILVKVIDPQGNSDFNAGANTFTITGGVATYDFTVSYNQFTCTTGKGATSGTVCDRLWFETTDTIVPIDQNQVVTDGQSDVNAFIIIDFTGTASSFDLNLSLETALPMGLFLKANVHNAYPADVNYVTTTSWMIATDVTPSGTQDLNIWFWADFQNYDVANGLDTQRTMDVNAGDYE